MDFGILPAPGLLGAFFSATSMIGYIAGEIASRFISRMAVPVRYFMANKTHPVPRLSTPTE